MIDKDFDKTNSYSKKDFSENSTIREETKDLKSEKKLYKKRKLKENVKKSKKYRIQKTFFSRLKQAVPFSRVMGKIIILYFIAVVFAGFLLMIPGIVDTTRGNKKLSWNLMSGIFNAASALSDTGITTSLIPASYTFWGHLIILILIQLGGIGVLTFKITFMILLNKKVSINDQIVAQTERGGIALANTTEMIKDAFIFLVFVELIGALLLFFGFYFIPVENSNDWNPNHNFIRSFWYGIFHSISATNNAGIDIFSNSSLKIYNENNYGYFIQVIFLFQWVIGGLGYPTYHDIKKKWRARATGSAAHFSLFTKLNFIVYTTLFILGPILVFGCELTLSHESKILYNPDGTNKVWYKSFMDIVINSSAARNSGFSTIDVNDFSSGSKLVLINLMFIGAAPSSTAGGIRTTTLAVLLLSIWSAVRNKQTVDAFGKKIPNETVKKANAVFFMSIFLVMVVLFIIYIDSYDVLKNQHKNVLNGSDSGIFVNLLLIVGSAFGTVGFSPYDNETITSLGTLSKITLILTMFIGQLGISNTLLAFVKPSNKQNHRNLEEDLMIG
ncbi:potassium transporter TrkG [Spiroplasma endosymbiont of Crioceris asparagi]|uniref:potassium transporter TrkG n=1 Tax=Spiroplasma endosymbiont of Crioceris asparagi TaxID=3066286 RepID=UPI0030D274C8